MSRASDALAFQRACAREEQLSARAIGSARVLEAAKASKPDPNELLPASSAEVEAMRSTLVGKAYGVVSAEVSRDGRRCVVVLGGGAS